MILINNVRKLYDKHIIIDNFSATIKDKEMVAIVGESGCGKSTLLNLIGQIDAEYYGTIIVDGIDVGKLSQKQRDKFIRYNINYLFQNFALIDNYSVEENLILALEYTNFSHKEKSNLIKKALKDVSLNNYENKKIYTLSGGEQQRVALARAILKPGNIILADEPTGNLDSKNSQLVMKILKKLQSDGKTIIIVTHDNELAKKCDRIIKL